MISPPRRAPTFIAIAIAFLALGPLSDAGFKSRGANGEYDSYGVPVEGEDTDSDFHKAARARIQEATQLLRERGFGGVADNIEKKLAGGKINIDLVANRHEYGSSVKSMCAMNVKSTVLFDYSVDALAAVLLHEQTHLDLVDLPSSEFEHCYVYWTEFLFLLEQKAAREAQPLPPAGSPERAALGKAIAEMEELISHIEFRYPAFAPFSDPTNPDPPPTLPPGNPSLTEEDPYAAKGSTVVVSAETPTGRISYTESSGGDLTATRFNFEGDTKTTISVATGIEEFTVIRAVTTAGDEHYVLCSGAAVGTGEPRVVAIKDTNSDLLADTAVPLTNLGAPLLSATSVQAVPKLGGGHVVYVLDAVQGQVRNTVDQDADLIPDAITTVYASSALSPSLFLAVDLSVVGTFDATTGAPTSTTHVAASSIFPYGDLLTPNDWAVTLVDTNGDGTADTASAQLTTTHLTLFAPHAASTPMKDDMVVIAVGPLGHTIEVRAHRGATVEVLGSGVATLGGTGIPGTSLAPGVQISLSRALNRSDNIELVDTTETFESGTPVKTGRVVPEVLATQPNTGLKVGGETVVLTGRNFDPDSVIMLDNPALDAPIIVTPDSVSSTSITFTTPASPFPDGVDLRVIVSAKGRPVAVGTTLFLVE